jgi:hypothetical protein
MQRSLITLAVASALMAEAGAEASTGGSASKPKPEVMKVKMQDGREVEFVGKRKLLKDVMVDGAAVKVRFDFRNGETRTFQVPDALLLQFAGHGASQKIGDETAGEDDVDDMTLAVDELITRLNAGEWSAKKEGGGFGGASVLVKALVEVTKKPIEEVKAFLKKSVEAGTTYQKLNDAFAEDETVGPVIKRLKKEKAGDAKVDTKALLGGLAT